jgi:hypothetical protein
MDGRNVGVEIELDPTLAADGATVSLDLQPSVTEFLGYFDQDAQKWYGAPSRHPSVTDLAEAQAKVPAGVIANPMFAVRKAAAKVSLTPGQAAVISRLEPTPPMPPLPSGYAAKSNLLVFVSARILEDSPLTPTAPARPTALDRAAKIILPRLEFKDATLRESIDFLRQKSATLDPEKKGVNFVLNPPAGEVPRITLSLTNIPVSEAARYVAKLAGLGVTTDHDAIVIEAKNAGIARDAAAPVVLSSTAGSGKRQCAIGAATGSSLVIGWAGVETAGGRMSCTGAGAGGRSFQRGVAILVRGRSSSAAKAAHQTAWRLAAEARRSANVQRPATMRMAALFSRRSSAMKWRELMGEGGLWFSGLGGSDDGFETLQLIGGNFAAVGIDQRGDRVRERALEEGLEHALERRAAGGGARLGGEEDVARAVRAMSQMAFFFEDAEERADGRIAGRIGQSGGDLGRGGFAAGIDDIHDLAFAAAEGIAGGRTGHAGFLAGVREGGKKNVLKS